MERNHVHFATSNPGSGEVISGMRTDCEILIYLDVPKFLKSGMKLYRSSNDVLLSRGKAGVIAPEFFLRVVERKTSKELFVGAAATSEDQKPKPSLTSQVPSLRPSGAGYEKKKPSLLSQPTMSLRPDGGKPSLLSKPVTSLRPSGAQPASSAAKDKEATSPDASPE